MKSPAHCKYQSSRSMVCKPGPRSLSRPTPHRRDGLLATCPTQCTSNAPAFSGTMDKSGISCGGSLLLIFRNTVPYPETAYFLPGDTGDRRGIRTIRTLNRYLVANLQSDGPWVVSVSNAIQQQAEQVSRVTTSSRAKQIDGISKSSMMLHSVLHLEQMSSARGILYVSGIFVVSSHRFSPRRWATGAFISLLAPGRHIIKIREVQERCSRSNGVLNLVTQYLSRAFTGKMLHHISASSLSADITRSQNALYHLTRAEFQRMGFIHSRRFQFGRGYVTLCAQASSPNPKATSKALRAKPQYYGYDSFFCLAHPKLQNQRTIAYSLRLRPRIFQKTF